MQRNGTCKRKKEGIVKDENAEVSAYLCQMACAEEECEKELQKIAEHFKIPACFLEAIPMKKGSGDDEIYNNGEKENEESTT